MPKTLSEIGQFFWNAILTVFFFILCGTVNSSLAQCNPILDFQVYYFVDLGDTVIKLYLDESSTFLAEADTFYGEVTLDTNCLTHRFKYTFEIHQYQRIMVSSENLPPGYNIDSVSRWVPVKVANPIRHNSNRNDVIVYSIPYSIIHYMSPLFTVHGHRFFCGVKTGNTFYYQYIDSWLGP